MKKVKPKICLIGVGKNNLYGHPNEDVIKGLEEIGSQVYRTDFNGEIIVKVNNKGKVTKISTYICKVY